MASNPKTDEEAKAWMQYYMHSYASAMKPSNFDNVFCHSVTCTSASLQTATTPARATFAFTMLDIYANHPRTDSPSIHGGAIAMFFDFTTSMVMLGTTKRSWETTGVTRNLNVTYFRPPLAGDRVVVECEVVQIGRRLATIKGEMKRERDGTVLAICTHEKARPDRTDTFRL